MAVTKAKVTAEQEVRNIAVELSKLEAGNLPAKIAYAVRACHIGKRNDKTLPALVTPDRLSDLAKEQGYALSRASISSYLKMWQFAIGKVEGRMADGTERKLAEHELPYKEGKSVNEYDVTDTVDVSWMTDEVVKTLINATAPKSRVERTTGAAKSIVEKVEAALPKAPVNPGSNAPADKIVAYTTDLLKRKAELLKTIEKLQQEVARIDAEVNLAEPEETEPEPTDAELAEIDAELVTA